MTRCLLGDQLIRPPGRTPRRALRMLMWLVVVVVVGVGLVVLLA